MAKVILCVVVMFWLSSCSHERAAADTQAVAEAADVDSVGGERNECVDSAGYNPLVEQAVAAWFFDNLLNFRSYKPIIQRLDMIDEHNYNYHVRYSATNNYGGTETNEMDFKVYIDVTDKNIDYKVENSTDKRLLESNHTLKPQPD